MAKNKSAPVDDTPSEALDSPVAMALTYGTHSVNIADLSPKAAAYLMQYGFAKSLQDSVAGMRAELTATKDADGNAKYTADEVNVILHDTQAERLGKILAGTIGIRAASGPKATPIESVIKRVALEEIRNAVAAKNAGKATKDVVKLPTGDALNSIVAKYIEKYLDRLTAEATRRMANIADLDDMFA